MPVIGPPVVAGRVLLIRVRPSVFPSFSLSVLPSRSFLGIGSLVLSETQYGARGPGLVVCDNAGFFIQNLFAPKLGKMGQKQVFLDLLENLVIDFF